METDAEKEIKRKKKKEEKAKEKALKKEKAALKAEEAARLRDQASSSRTKKTKKQKNVTEENEEVDNPDDYVYPETPVGEKKKLPRKLAKTYSPKDVEKSWYAWWNKSGFFSADPCSKKPTYVMVLPPPNVTGALHIGHALTIAIEDMLIRFNRMKGLNTLWVPSMDHGGIATQLVVERKLHQERNLTRNDLGRDAFLSEVWDWKKAYGGTILEQICQLGASLDWSRECFTMDEARSRAVTEAFVRLYEEGLIYRDKRLVKWDCTLRTAISGLEVEKEDLFRSTLLQVPGHEEAIEFGVLKLFAYQLEGDLGEIIVATSRIETMLGDTGIAVHPADERYKHLHNAVAVHPFSGRKIRIVADDFAKPDFGTGAVKITPAHDPDDFLVAKRHGLDFINVFTEDGRIDSKVSEEFAGMPRFKARVAITKALEEKGLYRGTEDYETTISRCSRSNDIVEYILKPQWYVKCDSMAKDALAAVFEGENRKIEIIPDSYKDEWKRWLEKIEDWCISRQIWWGHQIPAWYVTLEDDDSTEFGAYKDHWVVGRNVEETNGEAGSRFAGKKFKLTQDPDVLDTWFSSGLFPMAVFGWPDETNDLKAFYPTSVLETGHDILFFWVARMVMLAMKLGGDVPFRKVYLHPLVSDANKRKMSKSLGNVIDPLEVINGASLEDLQKRLEEGNLPASELCVAKESQRKAFPNGIPECGTDALRCALIGYMGQSDTICLDIQRVFTKRLWGNKLWNATRFVMDKLGNGYIPPSSITPSAMPISCQWILSVLNKAVAKTNLSLEAFQLFNAESAVYSWWHQLCDVFIELTKPYFSGNEFTTEREFARDTLWVCLDTGLKLLHPIMPFVTEELWQWLPQRTDTAVEESIMMCRYPSVIESWTNDKVEQEMDLVQAAVTAIRSQKKSLLLGKDGHERIHAFMLCQNEEVAKVIQSYELEISTLAACSSVKIMKYGSPPDQSISAKVTDELSVYIEQTSSGEKLRQQSEETSSERVLKDN